MRGTKVFFVSIVSGIQTLHFNPFIITFHSKSRDFQSRQKNEIWTEEKVYSYADRSYQVPGVTKQYQKWDWDYG